jgi:hypothetical protein
MMASDPSVFVINDDHSRSSLFPALGNYHINRMRLTRRSCEVGAKSCPAVSAEHKTKVSLPFAWLTLSNSGAFFRIYEQDNWNKTGA